MSTTKRTLKQELGSFTKKTGEEILAIRDTHSDTTYLITEVPETIMGHTEDSGDDGMGLALTRYMAWSKSYVLYYDSSDEYGGSDLRWLPRNYNDPKIQEGYL
jgi:hypothetical protein